MLPQTCGLHDSIVKTERRGISVMQKSGAHPETSGGCPGECGQSRVPEGQKGLENRRPSHPGRGGSTTGGTTDRRLSYLISSVPQRSPPLLRCTPQRTPLRAELEPTLLAGSPGAGAVCPYLGQGSGLHKLMCAVNMSCKEAGAQRDSVPKATQ